MALPDPPTAPLAPARNQDPETFNVRIAAFLAWIASFIQFIIDWNQAMPAEVDQAIADAVAAYDPDGQYSGAQIDGMFAAQRKSAEETAYFFAFTS